MCDSTGRKKPKTLSGIETMLLLSAKNWGTAGKNLKPYQGLKQMTTFLLNRDFKAGKNLKPYQGLKLEFQLSLAEIASRKKPKTLSGIETQSKIIWVLVL